MAVDLAELVPRLQASLTVPGSPSLFSFDSNLEGDWAAHLVNAFWQARLAGLFKEYRVEPDTEDVVPIDPDGTDLPEEVHQIIVEFAALIAIEARFMALANTRYKSGEQEAEVQRPLTLLGKILDYKRGVIADLKDGILDAGAKPTSVSFLNMVELRHDQISAGYSSWVN